MTKSLEGQRVLVVGGGSGIGLAVAEAALAEGAAVTIASSNLERVQASAERLGGGVRAARLDVTDEAQVADFFAAEPAFDHIVTTAGDWGGPRRGALADLDLSVAPDLFKVRFWGALALAKHGATKLSPGGSLTLTNGTIAHRPTKSSFVSTAMAGAIEHLVRGLAVELAPVRVNAVCPGLIRTDVWDRFPEATREDTFRQMTARQPLARIGETSETAQAYLYLMKGGYTTGQVLKVEGGATIV